MLPDAALQVAGGKKAPPHLTPIDRARAAHDQAEDDAEERQEMNRLDEDAWKDEAEDAEDAQRDAEADKADHGD